MNNIIYVLEAIIIILYSGTLFSEVSEASKITLLVASLEYTTCCRLAATP